LETKFGFLDLLKIGFRVAVVKLQGIRRNTSGLQFWWPMLDIPSLKYGKGLLRQRTFAVP
jgi:hypothetical protein